MFDLKNVYTYFKLNNVKLQVSDKFLNFSKNDLKQFKRLFAIH